MSTVEDIERHVLPSLDLPPFGRGIPVQMPAASDHMSRLLQLGDPDTLSLPPLLTPFHAFLEHDVSDVSGRIRQVRKLYVDSYRRGVREYPWDIIISYLHADQIGTRLSDLVSFVYDGVDDVLRAHGKRTFSSHGGEHRRLQLWDIVHRDTEHPHVIRAFARDLLAIPQGGDEGSPYEQHARSVITRLTHPYNADIKIPIPLESMTFIKLAIADRISLLFDGVSDTVFDKHDGSDIIFYTPQWSKFWVAPRINTEIPINVLELKWEDRYLILYPPIHEIGGYVIRVGAHHRPDGNRSWQAVYLQGGIVDKNGEFIHLNLETYVSPLATEDNGLGKLDERSGPRVSSYQNQGVVFDTKTRMVTVPTYETHQFIDALPLPLPHDVNKLLGLLNRQIQYYALTIEQNDQRQLINNAQALVGALVTINNQKDISSEKAEQAMQTMALAFLQAPNGTLDFFRASGLSAIFPRAARLDKKERMASLDRLDACFPTTEVDPENGTLNWKLDELGLYMAIIHASGNQYPTRMTKRSIAAQFCWLFDPRA